MLSEVVLACDGKKPQKVAFEALFDYHGKKDPSKLKSLSAKADTREMSLSYLGDIFPNLQILRLNNSIVTSLRDLCTQLNFLRVLSLEHCGLTSLDGIAAVSPRVQELYIGFNQISDVSELIGLNALKIVNLESNLIPYVEDVEVLKCCRSLKRLILRGNGAEEHPEYRSEIKRLIPKLAWLDDVKYEKEKVEEPVPVPEPEPEPVKPMVAPGSAAAPRKGLPRLKDAKEVPPRPLTVARQRQTMPTSRRAVAPMRKVKIWHNVGNIHL